MKALLLVWIGWAQSQTLSIDHFDTMAECEAAAAVLESHDRRFDDAKCLPYDAPADPALPTQSGRRAG